MQTTELRTESRHNWKAPKRERVYVGRVVNTDKSTGKSDILFEGTPVVGKLATFHPLHGHLKNIVAAKIPVEGGFIYKQIKLKTALQKGYYKVQANDKDKKQIESKLEALKATTEK